MIERNIDSPRWFVFPIWCVIEATSSLLPFKEEWNPSTIKVASRSTGCLQYQITPLSLYHLSMVHFLYYWIHYHDNCGSRYVVDTLSTNLIILMRMVNSLLTRSHANVNGSERHNIIENWFDFSLEITSFFLYCHKIQWYYLGRWYMLSVPFLSRLRVIFKCDS